MIQVGTIVKVCDKTGIVLGQCIKVLGHTNKRIGCVGDLVIISVKHVNIARLRRLKIAKRKRFYRGTLHRGLIVRTRAQIMRSSSIHLRFDENSVIIVNRKVVPITNRVFGPILRELCMKFPSLGCTTRFMI